MRPSEDFGRFGAEAPSAMFLLGAGEGHPSLHNADYDFPDELDPRRGARDDARRARRARLGSAGLALRSSAAPQKPVANAPAERSATAPQTAAPTIPAGALARSDGRRAHKA